MADYSTLKGFEIQSFATDPYASEVLAATWASGNDVNTIRSQTQGCGLLTAGLIAGGNGVPALPSTLGETEEYDGTSWAESGDLNTDRESPGVGGIQTAALCVAGYTTAYTAIVESYNGTSWATSPATLNSPRTYNIVAGTSTAMITAGGGPGTQDITESWNGSTWTEVGDLNTGRSYFSGAGTSTAGICAGGESPATPQVGTAETWDGTSWTEVNALARGGTSSTRGAMAGNAPNSSTLFFGGGSPVVALTESYNGTAWTEVADMGAARDFGPGGGGSGSSAFWATGKSAPGAKVATTYEFSAPSTVSIAQEGQVWYNTASNVLKGYGQQGTGAWASGGDLNTGRSHAGGGGDQTAATIAGNSNVPASQQLCETYDGTTWTEVNNLTVAKEESGSCGSSTSMGIFGSGTGDTDSSESWNGTCWTANNNLNTARYGIAGAGTSSSSLLGAGGAPTPAYGENVEEYNGTCWAAIADLATNTQYAFGQMGPTSACQIAGGQLPAITTNVQEWNDTSWTAGTAINTARRTGGSAGSTTLALIYGGDIPAAPVVALTESWDGSTWTEVADLATARYAAAQGQGVNAAMTAMSSGGDTAPGKVANTEEWSIPNAIKTFTSS